MSLAGSKPVTFIITKDRKVAEAFYGGTLGLRRLPGDDFAAVAFREREGDGGLAGGGGPGEEERRVHGRSGGETSAVSGPVVSGGRFQESRNTRPTPTQMAVSATLNAGKPASRPPRVWTWK